LLRKKKMEYAKRGNQNL